MARIFSIEVNYNNSVYHAMITVRETAFYKEYGITLQDDEVTDLLLSDKIISPEPGNYFFANTDDRDNTQFMKLILAAVASHIHSLQY